MSAVNLLLDRLDKPRATGPDRWRAACPVCGERNRSTLSIGVGNTGAVLIKCFKSECSPDQIAGALGLDLADLFPPKESHAGPLQRRRLLSAGQALGLLVDEANVIAVAGMTMGKGKLLSVADRERLIAASARVLFIADEVAA